MNLNLIFVALLLFFLVITALRATAAEFPQSLLTPQVLFGDFQNEMDSYLERVRPSCRIFNYANFRDRWDCQLPDSETQTDWYLISEEHGLTPAVYRARLSIVARPSQLTTQIRFSSERPLDMEERRAFYNLKFPLFDFSKASLDFSQMPIVISWNSGAETFSFLLQNRATSFEKFHYQQYRQDEFLYRRILFSVNNRTELNLLIKLHPSGTVQYFNNGTEITAMDFTSMSSMLRLGMRQFAHSFLENLMENADWPYVSISGKDDSEEE